MKKNFKQVLKRMSECAVKVSCNTASFNFTGQPKEPKELQKFFLNNK